MQAPKVPQQEGETVKDEAYYKKLSRRFFVFKTIGEKEVNELSDLGSHGQAKEYLSTYIFKEYLA